MGLFEYDIQKVVQRQKPGYVISTDRVRTDFFLYRNEGVVVYVNGVACTDLKVIDNVPTTILLYNHVTLSIQDEITILGFF